MRISDWSSDVCSSDLQIDGGLHRQKVKPEHRKIRRAGRKYRPRHLPCSPVSAQTGPNRFDIGIDFAARLWNRRDRKSVVSGKSVSVSVDLGGRGIITKKLIKYKTRWINTSQ